MKDTVCRTLGLLNCDYDGLMLESGCHSFTATCDTQTNKHDIKELVAAFFQLNFSTYFSSTFVCICISINIDKCCTKTKAHPLIQK